MSQHFKEQWVFIKLHLLHRPVHSYILHHQRHGDKPFLTIKNIWFRKKLVEICIV